MAYKCLCEQGLPQMWRPKCNEFIKNITQVLPIEVQANDGTDNFIDLTTVPVPESVFISMFGNQNPTKRLHQLRDIKNWQPAMEEAQNQDWEDGSFSRLRDGRLSATFIVPENSPMHQYALQALECVKPGVYLIDVSGQLLGYADPNTIKSDKKLYPLPVENWTILPVPTGSGTSVPMVTITITFHLSMRLDHWIVIQSQKDYLLNLNKSYELRQALLNTTTTPATTTSVQVSVSVAGNGILGNGQPLSGLTPSDFVIQNLTSGLAVTVVTATEITPGTYTLTFVAQTSLNNLEISIAGNLYISDSVTKQIP